MVVWLQELMKYQGKKYLNNFKLMSAGLFLKNNNNIY